MNANQTIGLRIQKARTAQGYTQEQLAAQLQTEGYEISRGTLAKIEVGIRALRADEAAVFVKLLAMSFDDLLSV